MMEPSNIDLQHQQELHGSSPLAASHFHPLESNHEWSQNLMFSRIRTSIESGRKPDIHSPMGLSLENGGNIIQDINGVLSSPRDFRLSYETTLLPLSTPMVQDLGFLWGANAEAYVSHPTHQPPIAQIKGDLSDSSAIEDYHLPPQQAFHLHQLEDKLLMRTRSSGCQMNGIQPPAGAGDLLFQTPSLATFGEAPTYGRGNYNMVLPSTNISSSSPQPSSFPGSIGMDLQALHLLASERFRKTFSQPSANSIPILREYVPYGLAHLQELSQGTSNNHLKVPTLLDGVPETKRPNSLLEQKTSQAAPKKQPRLESRSSFSPFKVRKEKLGDRIAALQQLVAPFGKTDTASVLMEAIGYIKFLQDQVETLSVPYMRSSGNKKLRTTQGEASEETNEPKLDLRSRGLCLVPLSCTSYVTNDNGGLWSPPNFRGGT